MRPALKRICTALGILLVASLPYRPASAKMTATLSVSVNVPDNCTVSTTGGPTDGYETTVVALPSEVDGESTLIIDCSEGTAPEISLSAPSQDAGGNSLGVGPSAGGTGQKKFVYTIYQRGPRHMTWGDAARSSSPVSKAVGSELSPHSAGAPGPRHSAAARSTREELLFATVTF